MSYHRDCLFCAAGYCLRHGYYEDLGEGRRWKEDGQRAVSAEERRKAWRTRWREWALEHCRRYGEVSADDVRRAVRACDPPDEPDHPNQYGTLFADRRFEDTGRRVLSKRVSARAREIRIWGLAS